MAYAAVTTLLDTLRGLFSPNPYVILEKNEHFDSYEKLRFLQAFLEGSDVCRDENAIKDVEKNITSWAAGAPRQQSSHFVESELVKVNLEKLYYKTPDEKVVGLSENITTSKELSRQRLNLESRGKIAYAAVSCLLECLDLLCCSPSFDFEENGQFDYLYENLAFLETLLKDNGKEISEHDVMEVLEQEILEVARKAQDLICLPSCCRSKDSKYNTGCRLLPTVEEIECIKIELQRIYDDVKMMHMGSVGIRISQGKEPFKYTSHPSNCSGC
ncbi:hypothetical protein Pfo_028162 [Paulownia fortunei]|nr:hypothetical protein Pfo_028162 [Paulownia fortunei]